VTSSFSKRWTKDRSRRFLFRRSKVIQAKVSIGVASPGKGVHRHQQTVGNRNQRPVLPSGALRVLLQTQHVPAVEGILVKSGTIL
jgi:hypothetical protein